MRRTNNQVRTVTKPFELRRQRACRSSVNVDGAQEKRRTKFENCGNVEKLLLLQEQKEISGTKCERPFNSDAHSGKTSKLRASEP